MPIEIVGRKEQLGRISKAISELGDGITILEAGCGRAWPLKLSIDYKLVGLDLDEAALKHRVEQTKDLDEYRVGDLCTAEFEPGSFDVIYCSYVLEHVVGVEKVLENFARWIRPGGLIVVRVPDKSSVHGLIARATPHWLHVAACRYINGNKNAGKIGHAPYPVIYEEAMSLGGMRRYCEAHGYDLAVNAIPAYKRWWIRPSAALVSLFSLGKLAWRHNNLTFLIHAGGGPRIAS